MKILKPDIEFCRKNMGRIPGTEAGKIRELEEFGIPRALINEVLSRDTKYDKFGSPLTSCIHAADPICQRLKPGYAPFALGHYMKDIRAALWSRFSRGTIVDFGCGPIVDISMTLALGASGFKVQLVDIEPMLLAYSSFMMAKRGIPNYTTLARDPEQEMELIDKDTVMIIESTSFEHVVGIRHLFTKLFDKLKPGGLFLTNFTRLNWSLPCYDGYQENKDYAGDCVAYLSARAERYEWEAAEQKLWDLWLKK